MEKACILLDGQLGRKLFSPGKKAS